ncbi:hypothetical protein AQ490_05945 [Wenjunlia vitaminophila]|uniref:FHA domain-containing protein n=1 Tax=Wenjunlia vitaminophila TaxID=76728 RepID=A0A0T6LPN0_WENVI|nr:FHA domain-containing protein [Wenjunlia vitaminophila]KRV47944.1 hypothetical protein AQ490_05945 [Wenjunlia vitaminophila]
MPTCPVGHESRTADYCEVCGRPMMTGRPRPTPRPAGGQYPETGPEHWDPDPDPESTAAVELCPRCRTPRENGEPFCEGCRWNFQASGGGMPPGPGMPPPAPVPAPPVAAHGGMPPGPAAPVPVRPAPVGHSGGGGWGDPAPDTGQTSYPLQPPTPHPGPLPGPRRAPSPWYVTVIADREYYTAMMGRSGPEAQSLFFPPYCPERRFELSGGQLRIGRTRHRPSEEVPEIDLSRPPEDPGVSHKHAVLVQQPDGAWAVMDQGSTNGTTINGAEEPITPFVPVPLAEGDRVHVGAWTTITVHRLDPSRP